MNTVPYCFILLFIICYLFIHILICIFSNFIIFDLIISSHSRNSRLGYQLMRPFKKNYFSITTKKFNYDFIFLFSPYFHVIYLYRSVFFSVCNEVMY